jgi:protein-arginine kinase activator protein McsA
VAEEEEGVPIKYRLEMRLFDGRMNETRDQALEDFERHHGYRPREDYIDGREEYHNSPTMIRESLKNHAHEKAIENAAKLVKDEINKLSGYF